MAAARVSAILSAATFAVVSAQSTIIRSTDASSQPSLSVVDIVGDVRNLQVDFKDMKLHLMSVTNQLAKLLATSDELPRAMAELYGRVEQLTQTAATLRTSLEDKDAEQDDRFHDLSSRLDELSHRTEQQEEAWHNQQDQMSRTIDEIRNNQTRRQSQWNAQQQQLTSSLNSLTARQDELELRWNSKLDEKVTSLNGSIAQVSSRLELLDRDCIERHEQLAVYLNTSYTNLEGSLSQLEDRMTDRADSLERKFGSLNESVVQISSVQLLNQRTWDDKFQQQKAAINVSIGDLSRDYARVVGNVAIINDSLHRISASVANHVTNFDMQLQSVQSDVMASMDALEASFTHRFQNLTSTLNSSVDTALRQQANLSNRLQQLQLSSAYFINASLSEKETNWNSRFNAILTSMKQKEENLTTQVQQLSASIISLVSSIGYNEANWNASLQEMTSSLSGLSTSLIQKEAVWNSRIQQLASSASSINASLTQMETNWSSRFQTLTSSVTTLSTSLDRKEAALDGRIQQLSSSTSSVSASLTQKEANWNGQFQTLTSSVRTLSTSLDQKDAALNSRIQQLTTSLQSAVSSSSRSVKRCRVCFREIEGSSQCQQNRNSCSGWSDAASWTLPFRDDTDRRGGGCTYQWMLECQV